jgi:hypothetical protein
MKKKKKEIFPAVNLVHDIIPTTPLSVPSPSGILYYIDYVITSPIEKINITVTFENLELKTALDNIRKEIGL